MSKTSQAARASKAATAVYARLLGYARPYRLRLALGILFGLIYAGANGALVFFIKGGFKGVFDPEHSSMLFLTVIVVGLPVVMMVRGAADFLATYCIQWVGNRVVMDLRNEMFSHLHTLSVSYFSQSRTGELISRTTNDTVMVERAVSAIVGDLAKQPLTLVGMVAAVFIVDAKLAAVSLIVFPLCILPIAAFGQRVRRYSRQAQEKIADFVSILQETATGVRIVKAFGMEEYEAGRFREQTKAFFRKVMGVAKANASLEPITGVIAAVSVSFLLVYVRATKMPVQDFAAFVGALFMMYEPVKKLSRIYLNIQQSAAASERIFEVLDTPRSVADASTASPFSGRVETIVFDRVRFAYGERAILTDISFTVRAGERVAIVGRTGSGKTTLVNLLPRFYDVTAGRVLLNGRDLREFTMKSVREQIGLVTQDTFLFNETVANNIGYGAMGMGRAAIEEAAKRAYADEFIAQMPERYDTVVGERGVRLSGGQRQRLAIARAIMRNPQILIFDEATSALDTESERMVQAALDRVMEGRTTFAIAHRLSTITRCDRIIVLDAGRIAEEGKHEALLAKDGLYKHLYNMQFQNGQDDAAT